MTESALPGDAPQAEHIHFLFDPHDTLRAFAAQRRRLAAAASTLSAEELSAPSRCRGWTVADVLRHLVWVDDVVHRVWSGDESLADGFDPRTTPDAFVQADRAVSDAETLDRYLASTAGMSEELQSAGPDRFGQPSLSPAGSVPWWLSAVHIGWDSAVHERDILVPLGRPVVANADETLPSLAYALVMASFFSGRAPLDVIVGPVHVRRGDGPVTAGVAPESRDTPGGDDVRPETITLSAGGPAPATDALSGRGSLSDVVAGDDATIDRLGGLARYFTALP